MARYPQLLDQILGGRLVADGAAFSVSLDNAERVSVIGDFNGWTPWVDTLSCEENVWRGAVAGARKGSLYKYRVAWATGGESDLPDPSAIYSEGPPGFASILWDLEYRWRHPQPERCSFHPAILDGDPAFGLHLAEEAQKMGFSHVRLSRLRAADMAIDRRAGAPQDVMQLIDTLHGLGICAIIEGGLFWREFYRADVTRLERNDDCTRSLFQYLGQDSLFRKYSHGDLVAAIDRAIVAPPRAIGLGLDDGGADLARRMAGDEWQRNANARLYLALVYALPAPKLVAQTPLHALLVGQLNHLLRTNGDLAQGDFSWLGPQDGDFSILTFARGNSTIVAVNCTPVPRPNYRVGAPRRGAWEEVLNTDGAENGGSGHGNLGAVETVPVPLANHPWSITLTLPPLSTLILEHRPE